MRRLAWTASCAFAVALLAIVMLAVSEVYLSSHGLHNVTRTRFIRSAFGVSLSLGDVIVLSATSLSAALAWWTHDQA